MKNCGRCKEAKSEENFFKNKALKSGLSNYCKPCHKKYMKDNPKYITKWRLKNCYGMTIEKKDVMLAAQNNKCAICKDELVGKKLHVDHCHTTGKIRAILCHHCNTGLGLFKDSAELLAKAAKYLKKHGSAGLAQR